MVERIRKFVSEVVIELKKVSWPTRKELLESAWIVFMSSAVLGVFIGVADFALSKFIGWVIR